MTEGFAHISAEATKAGELFLSLVGSDVILIVGLYNIDVPVGAKATAILAYSKDQLSPLLIDAVGAFKSFVPTKAAENTVAEPVVAEVQAQAEKTEEVIKEKKVKRKTAAPNGTTTTA